MARIVTALLSYFLLAGPVIALADIRAPHLLHRQNHQPQPLSPSGTQSRLCDDACAAFTGIVADSKCPLTVQCLCTTAFETALRQCVQCVLSVPGSQDATEGVKQNIQEYAQTCKSLGIEINVDVSANASSVVTTTGAIATTTGAKPGVTPNATATTTAIRSSDAAANATESIPPEAATSTPTSAGFAHRSSPYLGLLFGFATAYIAVL